MWYNNNYYHDYSYILKQWNLQIIVDLLRETLAMSVRTGIGHMESRKWKWETDTPESGNGHGKLKNLSREMFVFFSRGLVL